ncbi:transmembrane protein 256 homolog [Durio zibethinus]|uniref:Transmembrane protein 256 homolog n=1 Tax=Durio zibethinus TaxID=66656 RepID=A0A6P6A2F1_DURZI|nr:transmembrane protein 256 homolog [Durio zibethinus]
MPPEVKTEERRERMRISEMDPYHWHKIAAVSGIAALGLGTYGFHIFKPEKPIFKEVWQIASIYHFFHTAALLAAPITKRPHVFGALLTAGILTFSGSCYTAAYLEDRKFSALAPFGGLAFVAAWASLLF